MKKLIPLIAALLFCFEGYAQLWNYSDTVYHSSGSVARVYMWVPPSCGGNIRGLVMASQTVAEYQFVQDTALRRECNREMLALVFINASPVSNFGSSGAAAAADTLFINHMLSKLSTISGYREIPNLPWITIGHSTSSAFARNLAYWKPERTAGAIIFKGGAIAPPSWSSNSITEVPLLGVSGQFEEYGPNGGCAPPRGNDANYRAVADSILKLRANGQLGTAIMLHGEGHFGYTSRGAELIAKWIRKASQYRIKYDTFAVNNPVSLNIIPENSGWLSDTVVNQSGINVDTFTSFTNPVNAFWHFDQDFANDWKAFHLSEVGKQQQIITSNPSNYQDCSGMSYRFNVNLGVPFITTPVCATSTVFDFKIIAGPAKVSTGNVVDIIPELLNNNEAIWMNVVAPGTASHLLGERTFRLVIQRNTSGNAQTITPPSISPKAVGDVFSFAPTASSGLPVTYSIKAGPAIINTNGEIEIIPFNTQSGQSTVYVAMCQIGNSSFNTVIQELAIPVTGPITVANRRLIRNTSMVQIYPNPNQGRLIVAANTEIVRSVSLTDISGRPLFNQFINASGNIPINLPPRFKGLFILNVITDKGSTNHRLMVN